MRPEVVIVSHGRAGVVHYREGPNTHAFDWELGVGDVLMSIYVPAPAEWDAVLPWAANRREEVLARVGRAVARDEFPRGRVEISERWISVHAPRPPWNVIAAWIRRRVWPRPGTS